MKYISTRNSKETFTFKEVFIKGLADDGGLFIPQSLNKYSDTEINSFRELEYNQLAKKIISTFIGDFMSENNLSKIIDKSYSVFRKTNVVNLIEVGDRSVLELFHGPTLAFKDVAMQLLGNFYDSAKEIYLNQKTSMFLENYGVDILRLYAPVDGSEIGCSPKIWKVDDIKGDLVSALEANIPAVKIKGDYFLGESILGNLIKNAVEASKSKQTVKVELDNDKTNQVRIINETPVPEKIRDNFFDKYTTYGKSGGTGIGTYAAKQAVESQGGSISMTTSEEKGTTITICFNREDMMNVGNLEIPIDHSGSQDVDQDSTTY